MRTAGSTAPGAMSISQSGVPLSDAALAAAPSYHPPSHDGAPATLLGPPATVGASTERDGTRGLDEATSRGMELDEEISRSLDALGPGTPRKDSDAPRGLVFRSDEVTMSSVSAVGHPETVRDEPQEPATYGSPEAVPHAVSSSDVVINIEDSVVDVSQLDVAPVTTGPDLMEKTFSQPRDDEESLEEADLVEDDEIVIADDLAEMVDPEEIQDSVRKPALPKEE
jgi:hypothetical protein